RLERALRLDGQLPAVDPVPLVERRREIDVHDLPTARSRRREAKSRSDVRERAGRLRRARIAPPHAADIEEHGIADTEEPERIPVSEEPLLERQHRTVLPALIAQRIAPEPVVAAEQHLQL